MSGSSSEGLVVPLQLADLPADITLVDLLHDGAVGVDAQSRCVINLDRTGSAGFVSWKPALDA